ncbi:uncharacterized protein LOC120116064 [Hibiscus syriacus]|uniref:uncharacterized protein LOC120116064 n=1 Tax=Hibiscus syriacus TaxID=106335 RepID=UPI00192307D6|nr:uncharacterized protein LOC120116064 [Hibiscus syriacus]
MPFASILITFIIALGLLLIGVKLNERHDDAVVRDGVYNCYVIKPGVFAAGAILAALNVLIGVLYYETLNSKGKDASNVLSPKQGGITLAQPQLPVENPGFVHGDAHKKHQIG